MTFEAQRDAALEVRRRVNAYPLDDVRVINDWLREMAKGYPTLHKFEGGALWPAFDPYNNRPLMCGRGPCCGKLGLVRS